MDARLEFAIDAVERAGAITLEHFRKGVRIDFKPDDSPVTAADLQAEDCLRALIAESYPGEKSLGEEQGGHDAQERWVIDPIDGTKSFVRGVPLYATLLSFEEGGHPVVAAIRLPALRQTFWAAKGRGAYMNGERIQVSDEKRIGRAYITHGSINSLRRHGLMGAIDRLAEDAYALRGWGDAYGYTLLASGYVEAMLDPVVERYDISAPALLVEEAGGAVTTLDGKRELGANALATNGALHEEILKRIGE